MIMADFVIGDYKYTTITSNTVEVDVNDTTKSSYEDIPSSVIYGGVTYSVVDMYECFRGCTSLTQPPTIPNSVTNLYGCFRGCTSLTQAPEIPNSVTIMSNCFYGCTSLAQAPVIPSSVVNLFSCFYKCTSLTQAPVIPNAVTNMYDCFRGCTSLVQPPVIPNSIIDMAHCFRGCTSLVGDIYIYCDTLQLQMTYCFYDTTQPITLHAMNDNVEVCDLLAATANNDNVLVNIHSETPISFTDTQMNYMTNEGLKTLSLQTNANLVQCEVPDLVNGGTITTNVNDALVDLDNRTGAHPAFVGTIVKNGVSFTNNGDGSFTINGTAQQRVDQLLLVAPLIGTFRYKFTGGYVKWVTTGTVRRLLFGVQLIQKDAVGGTHGGMPTHTGAFDEMLRSSTIYAEVNFSVRSGETVDNLTITPAITKVGDV